MAFTAGMANTWRLISDSTVSRQSGPPSPAGTPLTVQRICPPTLSPFSRASAARRRSTSSSRTTAFTVISSVFKNVFARLPATVSGAVSRPENRPPPR